MLARPAAPTRCAALAPLLLLALLSLATLGPPAVRAATDPVMNSNDSGPGSLRAVIAAAAAGDTVVFNSGISKITLTQGQITIGTSITVYGPGVTVDGNANSLVLSVNNSSSVTLNGLTLTNGSGGLGGGLEEDTGASVTLLNCTLSNNTSVFSGAGLYQYSGTSATLIDCVISGNYAQGSSQIENTDLNTGGGGIYAVGSSLTLTRCIVSGNIASAQGGGLYDGTTGPTTVTACVFAGNQSGNHNMASGGNGGGIFNGSAGRLTVIGSTFTANTASGSPEAGVDLDNYTSDTSATLTDDIFYDPGPHITAANVSSSGTINATYCDIQQASGVFPGTGNLNADPQFVTPYDLHPQVGSPVVGMGIVVSGNETDITGRTRASQPTIGAYEVNVQTTPAVAVSVNSGNAVAYNVSVPVQVTVTNTSDSQATPTGTVDIDFGDGTQANGQTLAAGPSGTATVTVMHAFARPGPATVSAQYTSAAANFTNAYDSANITVGKAMPTLAVSSSLSPSDYGQSVTLTATFSGAYEPGGQSVTFKDGTTTLTSNAGIVNNGGVYMATFTTSALAAGSHSITASYGGDDNNAGTTSPPFNQGVNADDTSTAVSLNNGNPVPYNQSVPVKVIVSNTSFSNEATPTGTVNIDFGDGTYANGQTLAAGPPGAATVTVMHTFTQPGRVTVSADYSPAPDNFNHSNGSQNVTVSPAMPTLTLSSSSANNTSIYGQSVTFTATLSGAFQPSGSVTFTDSLNGGTATTLTSSAHILGDGKNDGIYTAQFKTSALAAGSHTITASYGGDNNNAAPMPASITQTVDAIASNVTGQVTVTRGGYRLVRATGHYLQPVTLTNNGAALADTVSLALDNLAPGAVTLVGAAGRTQYATPAGSPYVNLPPGGLAKGASATVTLEFTALPTGYTARVLAGAGVR